MADSSPPDNAVLGQKLISMFGRMAVSEDRQERSAYLAARACLMRAMGKGAEALSDAEAAMDAGLNVFGVRHQAVKSAIVEAVESAFSLGDYAKVRELVVWMEGLRPGERPLYLTAQAARFRARLGSIGDPGTVEPAFMDAAETFTQIGMPFWLAVTQLEHAEWLRAHGKDTETARLLADSARTFERLQARPWLDRARSSAPVAGVAS